MSVFAGPYRVRPVDTRRAATSLLDVRGTHLGRRQAPEDRLRRKAPPSPACPGRGILPHAHGYLHLPVHLWPRLCRAAGRVCRCAPALAEGRPGAAPRRILRQRQSPAGRCRPARDGQRRMAHPRPGFRQQGGCERGCVEPVARGEGAHRRPCSVLELLARGRAAQAKARLAAASPEARATAETTKRLRREQTCRTVP